MPLQVVTRPEAEVDLQDAFDWYEERVPGLGDQLLLSVDAALGAILRNPRQFPIVHRNVRRALTRRFPYKVFYLEEDDRIVILSIFHVKRDPKRWKERI